MNVTKKYLNPVKRIVGIRAEIELPARVYFETYGTPEYWKKLERELLKESNDLVDFIRDHRSRDSYEITLVKDTEEVCPFCGRTMEMDDGLPQCCNNAQDYYLGNITEEQAEKLVQYRSNL